MQIFSLLALLIGGFLLSLALVGGYIHYAKRVKIVDIPCKRSSHKSIVPRGGGIIFALIWLVGYLFFMITTWQGLAYAKMLLPALLLVTIAGFWEDVKGVSASIRFIIQAIAASLIVLSLGGIYELALGNTLVISALNIDSNIIGNIAAQLIAISIIIGIMWSTNLFNFMDGIDGIAVIEGIHFFTVGGLIYWFGGSYEWCVLSYLMVAILLGFLFFNWPPAKVFMGDAGSYFLGFLVAVYSLNGMFLFQIPLLVWMILYGIFWFDATITLMRRLITRQPWTSAHRFHAYQRLQDIGWSHKDILVGVIGLNTLLAILALVAYLNNMVEILFAVACCLLLVVYLLIEVRVPMQVTQTKVKG